MSLCILFEINYVASNFYVGKLDIGGYKLNNGAFRSFMLHFGRDFDSEVIFVDIGQSALKFATVASGNFNFVAEVFSVLSFYFERGSQSGRAYFKFIVLNVAVEFGFDFASYIGASVDVHACLGVKFYYDTIVVTDIDVYKKHISITDGIFHYFGQ